jgi:TatA/E family protein of Tat protein translocase
MFGIGMPELILILAVALVVIGPKKLPDLAKSLGKAMGEFKKATNDIKDSMQLDSGIEEVKTSFEDLGKELKAPLKTPESSGSGLDATASETAAVAADETVAVDEVETDEPGDATTPPEPPEPEATEQPDVSDPDVSDGDDAKTP